MSIRVDTSSWIPGAIVCGKRGLGVMAEAIPSDGDNGPSYLYNDVSLPADAGKEICGRITTWPGSGTLYAYEDGSFEFSDAPDGAYSFQYQLYVDGVASGVGTVSLQIGASSVTISATTANAVFSGSAGSGAAVSIGAIADGSVFSGGAVSIPASTALIGATTAAAIFSGAAEVISITYYPAPSDVRLGVSYGPTGIEYTGTMTGGAGLSAADIAAAVLAAIKADPSTLTVAKFLGLKE